MPRQKIIKNPRTTLLATAFAVAVSVLVILSIAYPISHDKINAFADPGQQQTSSTLTVVTVDSVNEPINGYYTALYQNGTRISAAFSPAEFTLNNGQEYLVSVSDYGDFAFDHWDDTGLANRERNVSLSSTGQLVAVYKNVNDENADNSNNNEGSDQTQEPTPAGQSNVVVRTIDSSSGNSEVSGYYAVLSQNGAIVATGFSPAEFTVDNGKEYQVSVSDYGSYFFGYWQDTKSTDRERTLTANGENLTLTAVYSTTASSPPTQGGEDDPDKDDSVIVGSGPYSLIVRTAIRDSSGNTNEISGYYAVLSQNGAEINTAFSPSKFILDGGADYVVSVSDYGDFAFDHWDDNNSTFRQRDVSISKDTEMTAIYREINNNDSNNNSSSSTTTTDNTTDTNSDGNDGTEDQPIQQGQSTLRINTVDLAGKTISGYYTILSQNGLQIESAFSPAKFTLENGQTYQISVGNYGDFAFDHWDDNNSTSVQRSVSASSDAQLTAVYQNIHGDNNGDNEQAPSSMNTSGTITAYAYRIPSPYWGPTFAGANANMFFVLYDSNLDLVQTGFADENGHTFEGLEDNATYYLYAADCGGCHNSNHDVLFRYWEDGSTESLRALNTAENASAKAYFEYVPW